MIKLIDNIPADIVVTTRDWVTSTKIPWYFFTHTLGDTEMGKSEVNQDVYQIQDMPRLTHYFYPNSTTAAKDKQMVMPLTNWCLANILPPNYIVSRVMGNLTTLRPGSELLLNTPHTDSNNSDRYTFLYYVDHSDGKTVFFEDGKIVFEAQPIKGTGILFNSNTVHAGQVPSKNKARYVLNIIFSKR